MVNQSELPFRQLCRQYGTTLAYSPMILAHKFISSPSYAADVFTTTSGDRPLVVQFCATDPHVLLAAAKRVEGMCDAIDLNLGCPQDVARRGGYGAFLMPRQHWATISAMISLLHRECRVPVTCKVRLYDDGLEASLQYYEMLQAAGASLLTIHARTREQRTRTPADWHMLRQIKDSGRINIPIIANGDLYAWQDIDDCLRETRCDAFMSGQGLQCNPAMFAPALTLSSTSTTPTAPATPTIVAAVASSLDRRTVRSLTWRASPALLYPSPSSSTATSSSIIASQCNCSTRTDTNGTNCICAMQERFTVASSYLDCCVTWRPSCAAIVRHHLYWMLLPVIQHHSDLYDTLFSASRLSVMRRVIAMAASRFYGRHASSVTPLRSGRPRRVNREGVWVPPPLGGLGDDGSGKGSEQLTCDDDNPQQQQQQHDTTNNTTNVVETKHAVPASSKNQKRQLKKSKKSTNTATTTPPSSSSSSSMNGNGMVMAGSKKRKKKAALKEKKKQQQPSMTPPQQSSPSLTLPISTPSAVASSSPLPAAIVNGNGNGVGKKKKGKANKAKRIRLFAPAANSSA